MSEAFDPYRKWLGIPPDEQPADHYRLLGVGRFEDDLDTISNAADRQMAHVRTFQAGPHSAVSQKLLNEISAARVCLLDRGKKREYDAHLRAKEAVQSAVPAATARQGSSWLTDAMPLATAAPAAAPFPPISLSQTPPKKKSPVAAVAAASVLLVAIGAAIVIIRQRSRPPENQPLSGEVYPAASDTATNRSAPDTPTNGDATAEEKLQPPAAEPNPKLDIVEAQWGEGDRWQDVSDRLRPLVYRERLVTTLAGNLLQGVPDPASGAHKRLRIRYRAAGQEQTAEFAEDDVIYLDGRPPTAREPSPQGLQVLDARYGLGATWVDVLPRVRRWVHGNRMAVYVDRVAQTDPLPGQRKALFVLYRTRDGEFVTHAWDYELLAIDARPVATAGRKTDLLAAAKTDGELTRGRWHRADQALVGPDAQPGNLTVPVPPLDEYLLTAVFAARPCPYDVSFAVPIGERQVQVVLDGWGRAMSGLQNVDGAMANQNASTQHGTFFEPGQETVVRCAVRKSSIYVTCNGRVAVDWRGDAHHLSAPPEVQIKDKSTMVVRSLGNSWQLTQLDVAPLGPEPSPSHAGEGKVVDLLKHIDPKLDAVSGEWKQTDAGLLAPVGEFMRLGVPYLPPDDYELRAVVERKSGSDALFLGLIIDGRPTYAVVDGWTGTKLGLDGLDGEGWDRNATTKATSVFVDQRPREFVCTVHPSSVHVTCDGRTLIDWHGDARRFLTKCGIPDNLGLQLGDWNTQFLISKFELRPIPPATCDAIEKLGQEFQIDTLAEKLALISEALTKAHLGSHNWNLAIQSLLLCDRARADERYEEARKFASLAAAAGRRTRSHDLTVYADARLARVRSRQEQHALFERALTRLEEQPDDAEANRTAGVDLCLFQGDWQRGLPLLAHSGDERLVEIARLEAVAGSDVAQRTALVDAWLAEAEKQTGALRSECQLQAKYWYERGLPPEALADTDRKAALAKLEPLPAISQARVKPGLDMAMFDGGDFQQFRARRVDEQICHHFGLGSPDPAVPGDYFSIRWTGWIKPPLPGKYLIKTTSDDSVRVRINGKLVIDHWNRGAGDEQAEVVLSDQLQPLSVEYNDYTAGADVCLSWSLKNFSDFQVVPPEALFHDPGVVP
jgi:hypothetical protein